MPIYPAMLQQMKLFANNPAMKSFPDMARTGIIDGYAGPPNPLAGKVWDANVLTKVLQKILVDHMPVGSMRSAGARSRSRHWQKAAKNAQEDATNDPSCFHFRTSIRACRVEVLAEIMHGNCHPFPGQIADSFMAVSGDEHGTMIEVYPEDTTL